MASTLIKVEHLWRYFGDTCAVNDVSFEIQRGEVLGFLGPNGAGKTTTMQVISGNLAPTAGRVLIDGVDLLDQPKRAKAALGFLPEQPPLYRELSVDEYLVFCARLNRIPRPRQRAAVARAKQRCGLDEVGPRLIGNLSKGYQQRVGIAQAIIHSPPVVILDEPTVGLDPIQIREIRGLIRELGQDHSVILSTHILPEVQAICDRVLVINQGRLLLSESLSDLARGQDQSSLRVTLAAAPATTDLDALPGVTGVEALGQGQFRLRHHPARSPTETLVRAAVEQGWGLRELVPETRTLEQVFIDLVFRDQTTRAAGADRP